MNIRDVGNTPDTSGADRVTSQKKPAEPVRAQEEKPVQAQQAIQVEQAKRDKQAEQRQDEYISSMVDTVHSASYSVFDVRRGKVDGLRALVQDGAYKPDGRKVALKLIDMILSTGRKNLIIYRNE